MPRLAERTRVLLVDDNADLRFVWRRLLVTAGFQVSEAPNGEEGLRRARELQPDLIVMDVSMPVLDGIAATARLKSQRETAAVPVIVISGEADTAERARAAGCEIFLTKPIRNQQLLEAIHRVLASHAPAHAHDSRTR